MDATTVDLADISIEWVIHMARQGGDTSPLIEHLRAGGKVTPDLAQCIADVLAGEVKAKPVRKTKMKVLSEQVGLLKAKIHAVRKMLAAPENADEWRALAAALKRAGYVGPVDSKGEITSAAKHLVAYVHGITLSQLDDLVVRRKSRKKIT